MKKPRSLVTGAFCSAAAGATGGAFILLGCHSFFFFTAAIAAPALATLRADFGHVGAVATHGFTAFAAGFPGFR